MSDAKTGQEDIRSQVESKHATKKEFLLQGLKRALIEEELHREQEHSNKYKRADERYGQSTRWDMRDAFKNQIEDLNN